MLDIFFDSLSYVIIASSSFFFLYRRSLRYLRYLQQEDYTAKRFIRWFVQNRAFDTRGTAIALTTYVIIWLMGYTLLTSSFDAIALAALAMTEGDPRRQGKLRLNMTERATRIFRLSLALSSVALLAAGLFAPSVPILWLTLIIIFQMIPLSLLAANALLHASEQRRQQQFVEEAKAIFSKVSPYTIGITGSYGKTSTKDALAQLLQIAVGPTFWPPKGINTFMGNTREIRSHLKVGHRYAIFEMGAYGRGSIKKLCSLTPPHAAIITVIGTAHLERFGSEGNILLAKSELAEAVPFDGILVCNGDNAGARSIATTHQKKTTLLYGFDRSLGHLDCWISFFSIEPKGTSFKLEWTGNTYTGFTPLFGKEALSNAVGAFTLACALGANPEYALAVLRQLQPVDNRLQVKKDNGATYLHDAYNSNPIGFAGALEVMKSLPGSRRIVMTPGIIELGPQQQAENERIGHLAGQICDLAIVVGNTNKESLSMGLHSSGLDKDKVIFCSTRDEAFRVLKEVQKNGDILLIENDLPDLYEATEKF